MDNIPKIGHQKLDDRFQILLQVLPSENYSKTYATSQELFTAMSRNFIHHYDFILLLRHPNLAPIRGIPKPPSCSVVSHLAKLSRFLHNKYLEILTQHLAFAPCPHRRTQSPWRGTPWCWTSWSRTWRSRTWRVASLGHLLSWEIVLYSNTMCKSRIH